MKLRFSLAMALASMVVLSLVGCSAEASYPTKPVQMVVPFAAGGGTDLVARAVAEVSQKYLGQPLVVVNKAGGSATVGTAEVAKAAPDGYTILMLPIGPGATQPHLSPVPYKVPDDFTPIAYMYELPMVLTVKADAPCEDLKGFIEWSKKESQGITFGQTAGSVLTLTLEDFRIKSGANLRYVPFDGSAPAFTALLGGHIQAIPAQPGDISGYLANKQVKVLATSGPQPITLGGKTIQTFKQQGFDVSLTAWGGIVGPKGMQADVVKKLEDAFRKISLEDAQYKEAMKKLEQDIVFKPGPEFKTIWVDSYNKFGAIIKATAK